MASETTRSGRLQEIVIEHTEIQEVGNPVAVVIGVEITGLQKVGAVDDKVEEVNATVVRTIHVGIAHIANAVLVRIALVAVGD